MTEATHLKDSSEFTVDLHKCIALKEHCYHIENKYNIMHWYEQWEDERNAYSVIIYFVAVWLNFPINSSKL